MTVHDLKGNRNGMRHLVTISLQMKDRNEEKHFSYHNLSTISISRGFVSSIFLKVINPALTIIVDKEGPKKEQKTVTKNEITRDTPIKTEKKFSVRHS